MKTIYHVVFFLSFFQLSALIIAGIGVFPQGTTLYSDVELERLEDNATDPVSMIGYLFAPSGSVAGVSANYSYFVAGQIVIGIIAIIALLGTAAAIFTHSYIPAVLGIFGVIFYPMVINSYSFFNRLLVHWDNTAIIYIGVTLVTGLIVTVIITLVEIPTQGRS